MVVTLFNENSFNILAENEHKINYFFTFFKIWLALMAITISSRIYFEIKKKDNNFAEFTSIILEKFIYSSREEDEIYIILPTFFIGWHQFKLFHEKFINELIKIAKKKGRPFNLAILSFEGIDLKDSINKLEKINPKDLESEADTSGAKEIFSSLRMKLKEAPLFQFHSQWYSDKNIYNKELTHYKFILELLKSLQEFNNLASDNSTNFFITHLKKDFFNTKIGVIDLEKNSDFFMFANITNPNYFFGEIKISHQEEIQFNSTNFLVKNIGPEIIAFFNSFIEKKGGTT